MPRLIPLPPGAQVCLPVCRHDMEQEVPFDPEALLGELYSLESIVHSVQAGEWAR